MTTYTCKCGRTFQSNSNSVTTGNRIPRTEYTPDHDCFGCPFVKEVNAEFVECRGTCNVPIYGTTASCVSSKASTFHVSSLDFDFIQDMQDYYNSLGVENPKDPPYPGMENGSGRYQFSFDFSKNNKGEKAKRDLIEHFFEPVQGEESYREMFARKDISGWAERTNLYHRIEKAKEEAKAMNTYYAPCGQKFSRSAGGVPEISIEVTGTTHGCFTCSHGLHEPETDEHGPRVTCECSRKKVEPADTPITLEESMAPAESKKYQYGGRIYQVKPCEGGKYRVFFCFAVDPSSETVCSNVPKCDSAKVAQIMLDDYAIKHDFEVYSEPTSEAETPPESDLPSDDTAEAAGEPENESAVQPEQDETPESEGGESDLEENPEDSENDEPETPQEPCGWQNASGADQDEDEEPAPDIPAGQSVSLRDSVFDEIIDACDTKINSALRVMLESHQHKFDFTAKVVFEQQGDRLSVTHETGYKFEPINYKDKATLYEDIQIVLGADGNPIIPYDREHQIKFDELQPGRVISPSGTATVDGKTGIVEDYHEDGDDPEDPPVGDDITDSVVGADLAENEESTQQLPPCDHEDCPFHGACYDDDSTGCCFDTEDPDDVNFAGDVWTAINMESCPRPEVLEAYRKNNPEDDYDGSDEPQESENNEEDYAS